MLDPFAGSGTLLLEASGRSLAALGVDINPAACYLARIYTLANRPLRVRQELCEKLEQLLQKHFPPDLPLFAIPGDKAPAQEKARLVEGIRQEVGQGDASILLAGLFVLCDFFDSGAQSRALFDAWKHLRALVLSLPESSQAIKVFNADARRVPIGDRQVDLVITSPPYVNVFNYHQHFRQTLEALGWQLLRVARAEIGSNRKHRANRFLTVIQYCLDMTQTFAELGRVCKRRSRVIFIVGRESRVRGIPFYNGRLIASVAETAGFELVTRQERVFMNRFGQPIFEDLLHLLPGARSVGDPLTTAREVALGNLREAIEVAAGEIQQNILDAIRLAATVQPSPLYERQNAFNRSNPTNGVRT